MADTKWSQFPSATPGNSDEVVGLHAGDNARFSIANIVAAVRNGLANIFVPKTDVGAAGGVASLDNTGKVPSTQLPPISSDADDITYDPTSSGLSATNVQDAIDEVYDDIPTQASDIGAQDEITANGILKGDGQGGVTAAIAGTDFQAPLTAGTDYATPGQLVDKANQAQLAYVETGNTATKTGGYNAGEYICWQGTLYTANTNIAYGTTLSADTGGNLTECVGGGFNSLRLKLAGSKTGKQAVPVPAGWTEVICMIWGVRDFTVSAVNVGRTVNTRFYADNTTGYVTITSSTCAIGEFTRNGQDQSSQCTLTVYYR